MTTKESAIYVQLQDLGYSQGMILMAMRILSQSKAAQEETLISKIGQKYHKFDSNHPQFCEGWIDACSLLY